MREGVKGLFHVLQRLLMSSEAATSGISETTAHQFWTKEMEDPEWTDIVPHFRHMSEAELAPYNVAGILKYHDPGKLNNII